MTAGATTTSGPVAPSGAQYTIEHGAQRAVITEVGATLRSYEVDGQAFLDGFAVSEMSTGGRGQVLTPWPNRLAGGSYEFAGTRYQLPISEAKTGNASHGLVRWVNWQVVAQDVASVTLGLTLHPQPGYPFALALALTYHLADDGLTVSTSARNVGTSALPFGIGFHPYFTVGTPLVDTAIFTLPAAISLPVDERMIPTGRAAVADGPLDFRSTRPIGDTVIDTCFTELARDEQDRARIVLAAPRGRPALMLTLDGAFDFVQVYTGNNLPDPATRRRGLAIEPMTCPANAFNSGDGLIILAPGEEFAAAWNVRVTR
jgi:aldose 1-epimerase